MLFQNKTKRDCFKINHRKKNLKIFFRGGTVRCGTFLRQCGASFCGRVSLQCACVQATACDLRMTVTMTHCLPAYTLVAPFFFLAKGSNVVVFDN